MKGLFLALGLSCLFGACDSERARTEPAASASTPTPAPSSSASSTARVDPARARQLAERLLIVDGHVDLPHRLER